MNVGFPVPPVAEDFTGLPELVPGNISKVLEPAKEASLFSGAFPVATM